MTYFFNGGVEKAYPGEERVLVPSWKGATYDLHPEMSAAQITEEAVTALRAGTFGTHVVNFANADMVGHTGKLRDREGDPDVGRLPRAPRKCLCPVRGPR